MEEYSVENIPHEKAWRVKDLSNKIVASFYELSACNAEAEAKKYANNLNENIDRARYRVFSDAVGRVCDSADYLREFTTILYEKVTATEDRPSISVEDILGTIRKELSTLSKAVAALPSINEINELSIIVGKSHISRLRGY